MRTYKLHLIRHGVTTGNLEGRYIGRTDLPLCEEGKEEILQILDEYEYPKVSAVYASPLTRCMQTAELIYPGYSIRPVANLTEMELGTFENKKLDELNDDPHFTSWLENTLENPPPGGEDPVAFVARLIQGVDEIFRDMMAMDIHDAAVITHAGVITALLTSLGLPRASVEEWKMRSGFGYTILMTPEMWTRDRMFEVYAKIPQSVEELNAQWLMERFGSAYDPYDEEEDDLW